MPQVHNPSRLMDMDSSAFGKNSRYMAAINFTAGSLRRMNALNFLDKRLMSIKVKYYDRHERLQDRKMERTRHRMVENLQKRLAYKLVLKSHSISKAKDYHAALNGNYSYESMQHEVKNMMHMMRPDHVRQSRARVLINEQKRRMDDVIQKNRANLDRIYPPPKKWEPPSFGKFDKTREKSEGDTLEPESTESPLPNIERRNRMSLHTLRRRIITLDDPKPMPPSPSLSRQPLSPIKSPAITKQQSSHSLTSPRKQAITISMTMMKKQKSFLETKEKTNLTETQNTENKENAVNKIIEEKNDDQNAVLEADLEKVKDDIADSDDKNETQKYKVLPPIKKPESNAAENDKAKINNQNRVGKFPVLKMQKGNR